jgi:hypothetical protein
MDQLYVNILNGRRKARLEIAVTDYTCVYHPYNGVRSAAVNA